MIDLQTLERDFALGKRNYEQTRTRVTMLNNALSSKKSLVSKYEADARRAQATAEKYAEDAKRAQQTADKYAEDFEKAKAESLPLEQELAKLTPQLDNYEESTKRLERQIADIKRGMSR